MIPIRLIDLLTKKVSALVMKKKIQANALRNGDPLEKSRGRERIKFIRG
jgi:hypothetical protein